MIRRFDDEMLHFICDFCQRALNSDIGKLYLLRFPVGWLIVEIKGKDGSVLNTKHKCKKCQLST